MNYLSFDVGIKNLAYCELTPQKEIKQWGIINMNSNPTCSMCLKKPCDKTLTCPYFLLITRIKINIGPLRTSIWPNFRRSGTKKITARETSVFAQ